MTVDFFKVSLPKTSIVCGRTRWCGTSGANWPFSGTIPAAWHLIKSKYLKAADIPEPITLKQAQKSPYWKEWDKATKIELENLDKHGTFELVDKKRHQRTIGTKWVFEAKHDKDGNIKQSKARLVAKGNNQTYMEHYDKTFAPVAFLSSIQMALDENFQSILCGKDTTLKGQPISIIRGATIADLIHGGFLDDSRGLGKFYCMDEEQREAVKDFMNNMKRQNLIRDAPSPWNSPLLAVPKTDQSARHGSHGFSSMA
eukprot:Stramenopile-MAST_4_protein_3268